ncbi:MAG TPA: ABC transporter substrate-binding protein [Candidatus Limnocylindria bacterium]|jgi:NitT/TauT family transport system substrate-binding protein|nr:ABC transporter substrate-binding protein [Candidatus Limnocylindria bacterium]
MERVSRGRALATGAAALVAVGGGIALMLPHRRGSAQPKVIVQYDWLMSNGQIGDVVAHERGFFSAEGLDVELAPGGPNSATAAPVIAGKAQLGQFSEAAQVLLARSSGVPIKLIAVGYRSAPFAFYSLPRTPVRTVAEMVGKRVGIQPTGRYVLDAVLAKNKIDASSMRITDIGSDLTPLVAGRVDVITSWITNTHALAALGPDRIELPMAKTGLPSYGDAYFATDDAIANDADVLARFLRAVSKGWGWAHAHPEEAVATAVRAYPSMDLAVERRTIATVLGLSFDATTAREGWGTFRRESIAEQIAVFDTAGQFKDGAPHVDDVVSTKILELTAADRPKLG